MHKFKTNNSSTNSKTSSASEAFKAYNLNTITSNKFQHEQLVLNGNFENSRWMDKALYKFLLEIYNTRRWIHLS